MATITLEINDHNDFKLLLRVAEKFGARLVKQKELHFSEASSKFKSKEEFWLLFGMGKNHPASLKQVREQIWDRRK